MNDILEFEQHNLILKLEEATLQGDDTRVRLLNKMIADIQAQLTPNVGHRYD